MMDKLFDYQGERTFALSANLWSETFNRINLLDSLSSKGIMVKGKETTLVVANHFDVLRELDNQVSNYDIGTLVFSVESDTKILIVLDSQVFKNIKSDINFILAKEVIILLNYGVISDMNKHHELFHSSFIELSEVNFLIPNHKFEKLRLSYNDKTIANMLDVKEHHIQSKVRLNYRYRKWQNSQ